MGRVEVGTCEGPRSRVQVLPSDSSRPEATARRRIEMEKANGRHCPDHVACPGGLRCAGGSVSNASTTWSVNCKRTLNWKPWSNRSAAYPLGKPATQLNAL